MAEQNNANGQAGAAQTAGQQEKSVNIQRIYVKDFSFESPQSPGIFTTEGFKPEFNLSLGSRSNKITDELWEVILDVSVKAEQDGKTVFLAELQQAGLFNISGFEESGDEIGMVLGGFCPGQLYPYAREVISNMVVQGTFPAPQLQPVNFDQLYLRQRQQQQEQAGAQQPGQGQA
ncbi:protein-export chaperone SecB [Natronospira bacteriovora]|uniref:Protein-export protein SecB n=1 Tax=Natronospira bacteriovora TaxID=3069753 RepID=A0ABU0W7Y8_9GAMM|nr:protein-export chaperone SecB [Natronospira sp. AB-CW4]MDQ2069868.1 protein-export chaperone SecB [Natronospira sp. AB-CW4]